jgi:hypothetical protein
MEKLVRTERRPDQITENVLKCCFQTENYKDHWKKIENPQNGNCMDLYWK